MSKRKISQQQQHRIKKRQEKHRDNVENTQEQSSLDNEQSGLLISRYGKQALVEDDTGLRHRCLMRQNIGTLVAGDRVVWCQGKESHGVIVARAPRSSVLGRPDKQSNIRPVAANISQMFIVVAPKPEICLYLLDSYLVAAEILKIKPIILFNKSDLAELSTLQQSYHALNYQTLSLSSLEGQGLKQLEALLASNTSVFVGQSGVGKSSLITHFIPNETISVGAISSQSNLGRHTTSNSVLYHLPQGGSLIDSPGIREFGLWHLSSEAILEGFIDLKKFKGQCKFRNCRHIHEPDCAIIKAVKNKDIAPERLASFHHLLETLSRN